MTDMKRLILNLFEMNCVSHITHGLWRLTGNNRERHNDIEYWMELARLLEDGGFDAVFLADVIGTYDVFRGSADTSIRAGLQIPNNDPSLVVPAMAAVTRHLGFGITFSTTYEPPFAWARRLSTRTLARTVAAPAEIPIGVLTAFFGAPFFIVILRHRART